eukprot:CAMPEP_0182508184 /NCGR_PEP_ID=MMETSP1321-20130603/24535_1 /TAXON_ID=91990 /ORGANISM="Bolidomonas sp., Strain RCC1657" /LENGTH=665 /DNA_ID=CAMNT_0024714221 /DNA_START=50 /DNA_END=2047 /DNA_ORIENTATION=-
MPKSSQISPACIKEEDNRVRDEILVLRTSDQPARPCGHVAQQFTSNNGGIGRQLSRFPLKDDATRILNLMAAIMKPKTLASTLPSCMTPSSSMTKADCVDIARGFNYLTKTTAEDGDAVGEFLKAYPAMQELSERYPGTFEDVLLLASVRLASDNKKYALVRLLFGALLSTFDSMTDIYMIFVFWRTGEKVYAYATVGFIMLSLFLQVLFVVLQNRKQPKGKIIKECLYVMSLTKPGVDAYRVAINAEDVPGSICSPRSEMMYFKGVELFAEAIPGSLVQSYAFLAGSNQSSAAVFSLAVSVSVAAFTSTTISFDIDMDRIKRGHSPNFYGYIPDATSKRVKMFLYIFLLSACQISAKIIACSLCAVESSKIVLTYLGVDMLFFLVYKLLRRDYQYWIPTNGCVISVVISLLFRVIVKSITDFTGLLHARHPLELGGTYWTFTLVSTPVVCFYFGFRYLSFVASGDHDLVTVLKPSQVYGTIGSLLLVQLISLGYFLKTIDRKFIKTFTSTETGNQYCENIFLKSEEDEHRIYILSKNRHKWRRVESQVIDWLNNMILVWQEEQPEWYNDQVRATIPDWCVRDKETLHMIRVSREERATIAAREIAKNRRRSVVAEILQECRLEMEVVETEVEVREAVSDSSSSDGKWGNSSSGEGEATMTFQSP